MNSLRKQFGLAHCHDSVIEGIDNNIGGCKQEPKTVK